MQVTANEFVMLICTLLAFMAGLCGYIFKINIALREAQRALRDAQKQNLALSAEIVALKKIAEQKEPASSDEFTKQLNYKKTFVA